MIDETDRQILNILQQNARTSNAEIARQVEMAPSAVLERIRRLESRGVIQGYEARIDPEALGLGLLAFVFVRTTDFVGEERAAEALAGIPEVLEVHTITGPGDMLCRVVARTNADLQRVIDSIVAVAGVVRAATVIALDTPVPYRILPLVHAAADGTARPVGGTA